MSDQSDQADQMAPGASPGAVPKKSGVRRVNNVPVYILGAVLGAFMLVMMLVAADRAARQNASAQGATEKAGNTSMFAREIVGDKEGGIVEPAPMPKPPELPAGPVLIARPDSLDAPHRHPEATWASRCTTMKPTASVWRSCKCSRKRSRPRPAFA